MEKYETIKLIQMCIVWSIELETPEKVKCDIFQIKLKSLKHIRIIIIIL